MSFSPERQADICNNRRSCYFGDFATLSEIDAMYGKGVSKAWLIPQLANLSEFCGCKEKITPNQMRECALLIAQNYYYLKVSELMLFFYDLKSGKYGLFYGSVDPIRIMQALRGFVSDRRAVLKAYEYEKDEEERRQRKKNAVTKEEYEKIIHQKIKYNNEN